MIASTNESLNKTTAAKIIKFDQQTIVFILFIIIFSVFSVSLQGFFAVGNMFAMLRSISVLGILGLGMAVVVIGRGVDLSMVALLAVPTGVILRSDEHTSELKSLMLTSYAVLCFTNKTHITYIYNS